MKNLKNSIYQIKKPKPKRKNNLILIKLFFCIFRKIFFKKAEN
jgi:hypothetical protein